MTGDRTLRAVVYSEGSVSRFGSLTVLCCWPSLFPAAELRQCQQTLAL